MTIRYKCDECGAVLNIKDELAGTLGHCPRCKVEFHVPAAEGIPLAGKESATVAGKPAAESEKRPAGAFGEDDIESILEGSGPVGTASSFDSGDEIGDGDADVDDEPRSKARRSRRSDDSDDEGDSSDDEDHDSDRKRKKKGKGAAKAGKATGDSEESAAIAKNLMGRSDQAALRDEKKGGRPFGGRDGDRDAVKGEYSAAEVAGYFAKHFWPVLLGCVVLLGLCIWMYTSLSPAPNLPPLVRVTGTVTLDGKPLPKALVRFQPIFESANKANLALATAYGTTDDNGKYDLVYMYVNERQVFGAPLGPHQVVITVTDKQGIELLPPKYSVGFKSELKATVTKGMPPKDFDLSSKEEAAAPGGVR
jgi:hypothetical protein